MSSISGCPRYALAETDSTNAEAMRRALAGEPLPFWVRADRQTAGRGRSGRTWISEAGNFHASLAMVLACPPATAPQLSFVAGVAALDALRRAEDAASALPLRLKWPNDILAGTAKAGGILIETSQRGSGTASIAVTGVGLNLSHTPPGLADATHLARHGLAVTPETFLDHLAAALDGWCAIWRGGVGFGAIRDAWSKRAGEPGEPMTVHVGGSLVTGRYAGLDTDGALLLDGADGRRRFTFGDVALAGTAAETSW